MQWCPGPLCQSVPQSLCNFDTTGCPALIGFFSPDFLVALSLPGSPFSSRYCALLSPQLAAALYAFEAHSTAVSC